MISVKNDLKNAVYGRSIFFTPKDDLYVKAIKWNGKNIKAIARILEKEYFHEFIFNKFDNGKSLEIIDLHGCKKYILGLNSYFVMNIRKPMIVKFLDLVFTEEEFKNIKFVKCNKNNTKEIDDISHLYKLDKRRASIYAIQWVGNNQNEVINFAKRNIGHDFSFVGTKFTPLVKIPKTKTIRIKDNKLGVVWTLSPNSYFTTNIKFYSDKKIIDKVFDSVFTESDFNSIFE